MSRSPSRCGCGCGIPLRNLVIWFGLPEPNHQISFSPQRRRTATPHRARPGADLRWATNAALLNIVAP